MALNRSDSNGGSNSSYYNRLLGDQLDTDNSHQEQALGSDNGINSHVNGQLSSEETSGYASEGRSTMEGFNITPNEKSSLMVPCIEDEGSISVVVLDMRQRKFRVTAMPHWTVAQFKEYSEAVHKVPPASQRLIYMGKLLQDSQTLRESNIFQSECVVHLFPKPNVVLLPPNAPADGATCATTDRGEPSRTESQATQTTNTELEEGVSAHIPQIIIDHDSMQHSYTIFTSNELFEAQHRVKLLSFILLIISSMELLTLFTIFISPPLPENDSDDSIPPGDPTDYTNPTASTDLQYRPWRQSDYIDLLVSMAGVYVSLLGLRASTENTVAGSKQYFISLLVVGISWLGYYFYIGVAKQGDQQNSQQGEDGGNNNSNEATAPVGNIYTQTLIGLTLPIAVWMICFLRAWQFRSLISEAQREAEERQNFRQATMPEGSEGNELILTASVV